MLLRLPGEQAHGPTSWESEVGAGAWTLLARPSGLTYDVPAGLTQTTMRGGQPLMLVEQFTPTC